MKLIIKNLKQVQYNIEIPSEKSTIKDLKDEIEKVHGFDSNLIKLLHNGKVLENEKTLEDYNLKDEYVIIMMNSKPKVKQNPQPVEQPKSSSPKKDEPQKKEEVKPKVNNSDNIQRLIDMGYEKEKVEKALNAARGNLELAAEFLSTGTIPEPSSNNFDFQPNISGSHQSGGLPLELKRIASFLKVACSQEPEKIFELLNIMKERNPSLINVLSQYEEEFKNELISPVTQEDINYTRSLIGEGREGRAIRINLTQEEREVVNRLKGLGDFSESEAIQAYLACDKNEELAANYLFEQKMYDDKEEMNNNNNQG